MPVSLIVTPIVITALALGIWLNWRKANVSEPQLAEGAETASQPRDADPLTESNPIADNGRAADRFQQNKRYYDIDGFFAQHDVVVSASPFARRIQSQ